MKIILASLVVLFLSGCTFFQTVGCKVETASAGAISAALANSLNCTNGPQILEDVSGFLAKTNICTLPSKKGLKGGPIATLVCPVVSELAVSELGTAIPKSWQCVPASSTSTSLAMALNSACNLIPF